MYMHKLIFIEAQNWYGLDEMFVELDLKRREKNDLQRNYRVLFTLK